MTIKTIEEYCYLKGVQDAIDLIESGVFHKGLNFKDSLQVLKGSLARVKAGKDVAL